MDISKYYNHCTVISGILYCYVLCKVVEPSEYSEDLSSLMNKDEDQYEWQEFLLNPKAILAIRPVSLKGFNEHFTYVEYGTNFVATLCMHVDHVADMWTQAMAGTLKNDEDGFYSDK